MPMFFKNEEGKGQLETLPLLPLRDVVIFPYMVAPLFVGREKSIRALEEAMKKSKEIFLVAQRDAKTNDPQEADIYDIGTIGTIVQMLRLRTAPLKCWSRVRGEAAFRAISRTRAISSSRWSRSPKRRTWGWKPKPS